MMAKNHEIYIISHISLCQGLFSNLTWQDQKKKRWFYIEYFILI